MEGRLLWVLGDLHKGSAFLNLLLNGCLSRFGKDWTNLRVCRGISEDFSTLEGAMTRIFTANGLNDLVWWGPEQLGDDGELIDMIFPGEQWLSLQHLGKDAPGTPYVDFHVVLLPRKHDLRGPIISCRDVTSHLRVLYAGKTKVTDLQVTVLVDEDIARLEVPMDHAGRVDVFQPSLV